MPPQEMTGICNSVRPNRRYFIAQQDKGGRREGQKFIVHCDNFDGAADELRYIQHLPRAVVGRGMHAAD
jgi:hypothetical protein